MGNFVLYLYITNDDGGMCADLEKMLFFDKIGVFYFFHKMYYLKGIYGTIYGRKIYGGVIVNL